MNTLATPQTTSDAAVSVNNLSLRYGAATVLQDITLQIPSGSVVGLVGRNGAGKSSLLRCLVGLTAPTEGDARLLGCPSKDLTDPVRERLGFVAQTPDLFDWMGVVDMLQTIGSAYPRWREVRALALASQLSLPLQGNVGKLSGGDQQKLSVVLALAHDPDVLLLDEPVSSLDPMTRREFMRALFTSPLASDSAPGQPERERTIIISSHLLADLERVVTHVAFMRQGRIQLFDAWDALLEHLRLLPLSQVTDQTAGVLSTNSHAQTCVLDTRLSPQHAHAGRAMALDELFAELNV